MVESLSLPTKLETILLENQHTNVIDDDKTI